MKAIFSIIGKYTDMFSEADVVKHVNYAHLSWEEIKQMNDSGLAEFQNHTYDMHVVDKRRGALPRKHESDEEYQRTIRNDLGKLNEEYKMHIGVEPVAFTCPFGCFNDRLKEAVRDAGFSIIFTSYQKINKLSGDPEELMKLNRFLRSHNKNVEKLINSWEEFYSVDNTKN
jgi:trehalose-6-phosphate synthase